LIEFFLIILCIFSTVFFFSFVLCCVHLSHFIKEPAAAVFIATHPAIAFPELAEIDETKVFQHFEWLLMFIMQIM